ncbi:MAG: hypothetical protein NTW10_12865 [Bacteroidetes bacterium]|nr:hypothetical protein [Bacteroidota bacterium]
MIIYRFRLTSEDHEDFLREIEIQPVQNFLDFHYAIVSCANLDNCDNALFYTTDNKFKKKLEFSFKYQKKQVRKYDDDIDQVVTEIYVPHLMKDSVLKNYIDDPHQRLIYEFTGKDSYILFIELFKIIKTDECFPLPRCVSAKGELPKKAAMPLTPDAGQPEKITPVPVAKAPAYFPGEKSMFSEMIEDDSELAEIESQLDDIMEEGKVIMPEKKPASSGRHEEDPFTDLDDNSEDIENLGEFDDIEGLEDKHPGFDSESDDY